MEKEEGIKTTINALKVQEMDAKQAVLSAT